MVKGGTYCAETLSFLISLTGGFNFGSQAPLACRNFIQLALEGYYDHTPIHRVIKDFMIQAGDPTGSGQGGKSIWGHSFKDELHGRIKFNHRGQVAMANENKPNSNGSQFFITTAPTAWLNQKHTIFGEVTSGYDIVQKIETTKTGPGDRPATPQKILKVYVKTN